MDGLIKFFEKFPDFFKSVTETIASNGPIALAVLVLFVLLAGVYFFRGPILASRFARVGVGALTLVFGGLLLYLLFQITQKFINDQETMVVIKGTVRYPFLGAEGGDLYFELVGPNTRNVGDSDDRFYSYDKSITEKRVIVIAKPERIELKVSNRPVYRQCTEDSAKVGARNRNNQTIYTIQLPDDAYHTPERGSNGAVIYSLDFEYRPSANRDLLRITGFRGIDAAKIAHDVRHFPDTCLDEDLQAKYVEVVVPRHSDNAPLKTSIAQVMNLLGEALVTKSNAQAKAKEPDKNVIDLLGTTDPTLSGKAQRAISQETADYAPAIAEILRSTDPRDVTRQVNTLVALKGAPANARISSAPIADVMRLSYSPSPELRQAARNYLTDPAVLNDMAVQAAEEHYQKEKNGLKGRDPDQFLLLALSMREIYYSAGINRVVDYVGNWGERPLNLGAINTSLKYFDAGIALIKDVPQANAVPYAKSYYGKVLALRSRATVTAAVATLGTGANSKDVDRAIYELVKKSAPLPFKDAERAQFISTLDSFLAITNGREREYLWPAHVTKMKSCRERQTYDCLRD